MSDQDRNRQREHWQAIAEQLGLDAEPESAIRESIPAKEPLWRLEKPPTEPLPEVGDSLPEEAEEVIPFIEERPLETPIAEPFGAGIEFAEKEPEQPAELERERPSRGRGRRRRGGREEESSGRDQSRESSETATVREKSTREESEEERGRRDRGRGRHRTGKSTRPVGASSDVKTAKDQEPEPDDEIEELGDFSIWNVPSWNELIASLYRPER
jgi:hypothetical protein